MKRLLRSCASTTALALALFASAGLALTTHPAASLELSVPVEHQNRQPKAVLSVRNWGGVYGEPNASSEYPLTQQSPAVIAYQYVIVVGVFAMVAVLAPLHALMPQVGRVLWYSLALLAAIASGIAAIVGATLAHSLDPVNGTIWQATPTAVFMLCLAFLIQIQVVGGYHVLSLRARFPGRIRLTALQDHHWRDDVSSEEYSRLVAESGIGGNLLKFGSEADQDASVVALLPTMKRWSGYGPSPRVVSENADHLQASDVIFRNVPADLSGRMYTRHEPSGLVLLGSVRFANLWLEPLLEAMRCQPRNALATVHHVCIVLWWLGMIFGALSKTGFNARRDPVDLAEGVKNLRTAGIWVEALLLVIAVYALPYTRSVARYGTRVWPRLGLLFVQTIASFFVGLFMLILVREQARNQNLIAYAISLMVAATAACVWCLVSVHAYQRAVRIMLSKSTDMNRSSFAYIAALVTRPRYGYQGSSPVLRWGDIDHTGHAALEVSIDREPEAVQNLEVVEARMVDNEVGGEWMLLENAAKPRLF